MLEELQQIQLLNDAIAVLTETLPPRPPMKPFTSVEVYAARGRPIAPQRKWMETRKAWAKRQDAWGTQMDRWIKETVEAKLQAKEERAEFSAERRAELDDWDKRCEPIRRQIARLVNQRAHLIERMQP